MLCRHLFSIRRPSFSMMDSFVISRKINHQPVSSSHLYIDQIACVSAPFPWTGAGAWGGTLYSQKFVWNKLFIGAPLRLHGFIMSTCLYLAHGLLTKTRLEFDKHPTSRRNAIACMQPYRFTSSASSSPGPYTTSSPAQPPVQPHT